MQETINQLYIDSQKDLENAVQRLGILPYFRSGIPGFSIEEHVNPRIWFSEEEGTWEWKGPVIQNIKSRLHIAAENCCWNLPISDGMDMIWIPAMKKDLFLIGIMSCID